VRQTAYAALPRGLPNDRPRIAGEGDPKPKRRAIDGSTKPIKVIRFARRLSYRRLGRTGLAVAGPSAPRANPP